MERKEIRTYSVKKSKKKQAIKVLDSFVDKATGKHKESDIEKILRIWLQESGIPFVQEKFVNYKGKWKSYDFLITDGLNYTFLLEADGDYWHDPNGKSKLQKKNVRNDKLKNKIAKEMGIPLLRFPETEIKNAFKSVAEKILKEIERQRPK